MKKPFFSSLLVIAVSVMASAAQAGVVTMLTFDEPLVLFQGYLAGMGSQDQFVALIDNLQATAPDGNTVPEPGTLALAGLACLALGTASRRRQPRFQV